MIIGVDEAGRGPLAGCVVACALYIKNNKRKGIEAALRKVSNGFKVPGSSCNLMPLEKVHFVRSLLSNGVKERGSLTGFTIKDSKKLSLAQREIIFEQFRKNAVFSVGLATNKEIDKFNVLKATFIAFDRAIKGLLKKNPRIKKADFIIDGNRFSTNIPIKYQCVVKADEKIAEVAFASIIAKLFRDHLMGVADMCFPQWHFLKHKGYPTREHMDIITQHSLCPLHRRSFIPCHLDKKEIITNQRH